MRPEHWLYTIPLRLRSLFRWAQADQELDDELRDHLERKTEEYITQGVTQEEAHRRARLDLGGTEQTKEKCRDARRVNWIQDLLQDIRYGLRTLRKSPGFTAIAVLTLALGIGANTAIFSLADAFLIKVLPVKDPQQLVFIRATNARRGTYGYFSYPTFERFRDGNHTFAGMFAWDDSHAMVTIDGQPEFVNCDFVSGNYFDVLGARALVGRTLGSDDDQANSKPVAVISYRYWERRFGRSSDAIGKNITIGRVPFTIIGITRASFSGRNVAGRPADFVLPMAVHPQLALGDHDTFEIMARLKPNVSSEQARIELDMIYQQFLRQQAGTQLSPQDEQEIDKQRIVLKPGLRGESQPTDNFSLEIQILAAVVGVALLIACVNVACLLLARASARQKEMALRVAMGAGRGRLVRQLLTESVLLALLGGVLGMLFARWGANLLFAVLANSEAVIPFDFHILAFTLAVSVLTGAFFGLAPALTGTRIDLNATLQGSESYRERRLSPRVLSKALVISQFALSLSLLIGAGLLIRSLQFLYSVDTGFERNKVLQIWVLPALNGYDHASEMNLYPQLLQKLNAIPGVQSASLSRLRMIFGRWNRDVWAPESSIAGPRQVYCDPAGPQFFATMGIPLLLGREFSLADTATSPKVAIISESMAREFFAERNPIGQRFRFDHLDSGPEITVVGVVKDIKHRLAEERTGAAAFVPYNQAPPDMYGQMNLVVRTAGEPSTVAPAIRAAIQSVDNNLPLGEITTQEAEIDEYLGEQRSITTLLSIFAGLALLLAAIGLYGTMSYAVGRRTKELGIRIALGAQRAELLQMVLRETLLLLIIGVVLGVPLAIAASRLLDSMLFTVKGSDLLTIAVAILIMSGIALLAGFVPARRAMRVDPIVALRYE